jgi:hypothetical protein
MNNGCLMDCKGINQRLDDYLDGLVKPEEIAAIESHASACPTCRTLLVRERRIRRALRELPAPEPTGAFLERALAQAVARDQPQRHWRLPGLALAASVMLIFAINLLLKHDTIPVRDIPGLAIALNQTQEVRLVFESEHAMDNARFTIQLPEGIELSGHPGQREITWDGSLAQGTNLLVLPVEARSGHGGELVAYVSHTGKRKDFVLRMDVESPLQPPITELEQHAAPMTVM